MTNLVMLYPQAFRDGTVLSSETAATGYPHSNVYDGCREDFYLENAAGTSNTTDIDMGSAVNLEAIAIANIGEVVKRDSADTTITVYADDNSSFTSPDSDSVSIGYYDLLGANKNDYVFDFSATITTAYRYWRFVISTTASIKQQFSNTYLCVPLDLERDPIAEDYEQSSSRRIWSDGNLRNFNLVFHGVSETKKRELQSKILNYRQTVPVFLWDKNDVLFAGDRLMLASVGITEFERTGNSEHTITMPLMEMP